MVAMAVVIARVLREPERRAERAVAAPALEPCV